VSLGISSFEAEVYNELISDPVINIGKICTKLNTYKVKLYEAINSLVEKGLVKKMGHKYNDIYPESPSKVLEIIQNKEREINQISQNFEIALPSLERDFFNNSKKSDVFTYSGKHNFVKLTNILLDELPMDSTIYTLANGLDFYEIVDFFYFNGPWIKKRLSKRIKVKMIASHENFRVQSFIERNEVELREVKFLPENTKFSPSSLWICNNKIINWNTILPKAVIIEDQILANFYIDVFEYIWGTL